MTTKYTKEEKQEAIKNLKKLIKPGDTVYTTLIHVSKSGMYRVIGLYVIKDNQPIWISGHAAKLLEGYDKKHEGCKASGCGMDMGFHLVHNLSYALFPDGFDCVGDKCPSNDHANRVDTSHHSSGGYALHQRWM